ncbi:MAG: phosphatase PAP2 family protein [Oscillospiraceae bacterium]|nr:phosphatase PAP2 family protein [Oscillospiraceae bacterium]
MFTALQTMLNSVAVSFDLPILDWIQETMQCTFLDKTMPVVTLFGDGGVFWIGIAVLLLFFAKYRKTGFSMGMALVLGLVVCNITLKPLVARIRPYDFQLQEFGREITLLISAQHDFSFPSGHTIASFEACTVLLLHDKRMGIPATVLAILIAFSRLYLYVHYPTDVLVSLVLGIAFGLLGNFLVNLIYKKWVYNGKYAE